MPYADLNSQAAVASHRRANRRHYAANREASIARSAKFNREHRETVNKSSVERRSKRLPIAQVLFNNAKARARAKGIEFSICLADIRVPEFCPVLGLPLIVGTSHAKDNSPSLDRISPTRGYVPENVMVISHKANTIKSNASFDDLLRVVAYMELHSNVE